MRIDTLLFSFKGRITRREFWSGLALAWVSFVVLYVFLQASAGEASTLVLYPPFLWANVALAVKRLHDRDGSGWWLLVALVPIAGPLWLIVRLGFRQGTLGDNRFGPDPRHWHADYLAVKVPE